MLLYQCKAAVKLNEGPTKIDFQKLVHSDLVIKFDSLICGKLFESNKSLSKHALLQPLPADFTYVTTNVPGPGVWMPSDPLIGCNCIGGCAIHLKSGRCCPGFHKGRNAYESGLVKLRPGKPIFECNSRFGL